ncbi:Uncharacterised protein [Bergeyella zoohelcum]|uniref:Uncharacterized protein n=1 Tax=Bergeyella zoohelcum TaxID=1015 RepID=A0A7Z8YN07_9FLAO|nr:Uncharacterised protein [Bergeyella zoohelcum]
MPNCSNCGKYIQPTEVYRRQMYVGKTNRVNYGKRVTFGNSNHYRMQNVCAKCARELDQEYERSKSVKGCIVLVILIIIVLYFILN